MATIKDVARLAGVGLGTASRVISGKGSVSPATMARVKKAIEELEFSPSHAARALLSGNSRMIGVYIPVLSGTFYTPMLQMIDTELRAANLHMVLSFGVGIGDERRQAIEGIKFLLDRGCDGLIVMSGALQEEDIALLGPKQNRLVLLNHSIPKIADQCFTVDHTHGGMLAAQTLLQYKHRKIAVITGPAGFLDNRQRIAGFMEELERNRIDTRKLWIAESDFSPAGGLNAARELVESGHACTALFCANDEMAVGALSYFQEVGIRVPDDLSVIAYDDTPSSAFSAPRLTTVHMPWQEMTHSALNDLLNRCYDMKRPVKRKYPVSVTLRASVAKRSAGK